MKLGTLKATARDSEGKNAARDTRRKGSLPAVLYGGGKDSVSIKVQMSDFVQLVHGALGEHAIVELEVDGARSEKTPALLKAVQHHPVRGHFTHADFVRISLDEKIRLTIPIHLEGRPEGVIKGGILDHQIRVVDVECLPLDAPSELTVDVSKLEIGDNLHVSDLTAPPNVTIVTPSNYAIAAVLESRLTRKAEQLAVEAQEIGAEFGAEADEPTEEGGGEGKEE